MRVGVGVDERGLPGRSEAGEVRVGWRRSALLCGWGLPNLSGDGSVLLTPHSQTHEIPSCPLVAGRCCVDPAHDCNCPNSLAGCRGSGGESGNQNEARFEDLELGGHGGEEDAGGRAAGHQ